MRILLNNTDGVRVIYRTPPHSFMLALCGVYARRQITSVDVSGARLRMPSPMVASERWGTSAIPCPIFSDPPNLRVLPTSRGCGTIAEILNPEYDTSVGGSAHGITPRPTRTSPAKLCKSKIQFVEVCIGRAVRVRHANRGSALLTLVGTIPLLTDLSAVAKLNSSSQGAVSAEDSTKTVGR